MKKDNIYTKTKVDAVDPLLTVLYDSFGSHQQLSELNGIYSSVLTWPWMELDSRVVKIIGKMSVFTSSSDALPNNTSRFSSRYTVA